MKWNISIEQPDIKGEAIMYTDIKTILEHANKNHYAVLAASAFNMELARGLIGGADQMDAPLIILVGQAQMTKHARPEIFVPMVKTLAEETRVPVAMILDHGRDWDKITWAYRMGFSSIMIDASAYGFEENVARTKKVVELCHPQGLAVEGELGHVGQAATLDGCDAALYTKPEEAVRFVAETGVDSLAIACGTAHGNYPKGFVPTLNFDVIRQVKAATGMPLALHGGSGSGDDNIRKAVEAGINKVNIATEIFNSCRDHAKICLDKNPDLDYMSLMMEVEAACQEAVKHFISLTGSAGRGKDFAPKYSFCHSISKIDTGVGE